MPTISKIRIVNFAYNEGKRIIPDELFVFENKDHQCVDTLINLHNGGGKSVIIQLIMQNVLPRTTLQGRRIESYFTKSTDHSFVLIEWKLDKSNCKLMTGIAMAAGLNADSGNNTAVRYFTFTHDYDIKGDKNDILSIPLSRRENGRFKAVSFEEARTYIKNSSKIEYFSSDDVRGYYDSLNDYGILRSEWEKILRPINNREGGVEDFFKNCKTADALLNDFIIPGISGGNEVKRSDDDSSMESMFRNYAGRYASRRDTIALRDDTQEFVKSLEELEPCVAKLWEIWTEYNSSVERLYDYGYSVKIRLKETEDKADRVKEQTEEQQKALEHIKLEELSGRYYLYRDEYDALYKSHSEESERLSDVREKRDKAAHSVDVLNAAGCYQRLCELTGKRDGIILQIEEKKNKSENAYLHSLSYSLKRAAEYCKAENDKSLALLKRKIDENEGLVRQNTEKYSSLEAQVKSLDGNANRLTGIKETREKAIDRSMERLDVHITKRLDGSYSNEDITRIRTELENRHKELCSLAHELHMQFEALEKEADELKDKKVNIGVRLSELEREMGDTADRINEYKSILARVLAVYEEWNVGKDKLFTEEVKNLLTDRAAEFASELKQTEKRLDSMREQLDCANNGRLHIPSSVHSFLSDLDISCQTGEKYLLKLERFVREEILKCNPSAAYSVIVEDDRQRSRVFAAVTDELWLSALLPVYTYKDFAAMAEGNFRAGDNILSAYSGEYFNNNADYISALEDKVAGLEKETELEKNMLANVSNQLALLKEFDYSPEYYDKLVLAQNKLNEERTASEQEIRNIGARLDDIDKEKGELKEHINSNNAQIGRAERNVKDFEELTFSITGYDKACEEYNSTKRELSQKSRMLSEIKEQLEVLRQKSENLSHSISECKRADEDYTETLARVKDSAEGELLEGDYCSLKARYEEYIKSSSKELEALQATLKGYDKDIKKENAALEGWYIKPEEYESTPFSQEELDRIREEMSGLDKQIMEKQKQVNEIFAGMTKAEANADSYLRQLEDLKAQPLPKGEIGDNLESRRRKCKALIKELKEQGGRLNKEIYKLNSEGLSISRSLNKYKIDYQPKEMDIEGCDIGGLEDSIEAALNSLRKKEREFLNNVNSNLADFAGKNNIFKGTVEGICTYAESAGENREKYYTLYERLPNDIERYKKQVAKLEVDLADIDSSKTQLVNLCTNQAEGLYQNLKALTKKSAVSIYGSSKNMLKINLPEVEDRTLAQRNIEKHIEQCVKEYVDMSLDSSATENATDRLIAKSVAMRKLLNCYIGSEDIPVSVYKIDSNPRSSGYRAWENAITANSGGEKFIVFFALVLSMMNYSRGVMQSMDKSGGVLIMDNPFGPISSGHLLKPMFEIARHFKIQLICFSHLDTAEITACFSNVCRLKTKQLPFDGKEILEAQREEQQEMEHAFFRAEQMSLLQE